MLVILLIFMFSRPFISSPAFPYLNSGYSFFFLAFLAAWIIRKGLPVKKLVSLEIPLLLFCSGVALSTFFSVDIPNSARELYKYLTAILIFITAIRLSDEEKLSAIRFILLSAVIISFLAIYQYFFGFKHLSEYISQGGNFSIFTKDYIQSKRAFLPFITPNVLGGYLAMCIPLTLVEKKNNWMIIPIFSALLLTRSLGALLSLFFVLTIYSCLKIKTLRKKLLLLAALLVLITFVFLNRSLTGQYHLTPGFSTTMRSSYWLDTLRFIYAHPFFGAGPGNFNLPDSRYAHNSYLQIWAEMGIISLIAFIWMVISILRNSFMSGKGRNDPKSALFIILALSAFLIHNIFDFTFFLPEVSLIWWFLLGFIL